MIKPIGFNANRLGHALGVREEDLLNGLLYLFRDRYVAGKDGNVDTLNEMNGDVILEAKDIPFGDTNVEATLYGLYQQELSLGGEVRAYTYVYETTEDEVIVPAQGEYDLSLKVLNNFLPSQSGIMTWNGTDLPATTGLTTLPNGGMLIPILQTKPIQKVDFLITLHCENDDPTPELGYLPMPIRLDGELIDQTNTIKGYDLTFDKLRHTTWINTIGFDDDLFTKGLTISLANNSDTPFKFKKVRLEISSR